MLPKRYQILPFSIPFVMPEFHFHKKPDDKTLALENIDCELWFDQFAELVKSAIEKRYYLPICRLSDGEFSFLVGKQKPFYRSSIKRNVVGFFSKIKDIFENSKDFEAGEVGLYKSGTYSQKERKEILGIYLKNLKTLSEHGILALHLSYIKVPFQERFFPAIKSLFDKEGIVLTNQNYFPFYFVYGLVTGSKRKEILKNRRVLIIHSAEGKKRQSIENSLINEGVIEVFWFQISNDRSMFDSIDVEKFKDEVDIVFVGAGIGKPNILVQLKVLNVPCIDLGYIFEVWADSSKKFDRAGCASDKDWELKSNLIKNN